MAKHSSSKIHLGVKNPSTPKHSKLFFIVSLTIVFGILLNIQAMFPFGFGHTDAFDGIFYFPTLILVGFLVGIFGLIRPPRLLRDIWLASFCGHVIYIITFTAFSSYDLNLLPFAIAFCALFSLLPQGGAFLGKSLNNSIFDKK